MTEASLFIVNEICENEEDDDTIGEKLDTLFRKHTLKGSRPRNNEGTNLLGTRDRLLRKSTLLGSRNRLLKMHSELGSNREKSLRKFTL